MPAPVRPAAPLKAAAKPRILPPVGFATLKLRHKLVLGSFLICVALPTVLAALYLWLVADDQYASTVGFSVRTEEASSPLEVLGGITDLSGSSSKDTDILYEYLKSQKLVAEIDAELDLRAMWSRPRFDPIFAYDTDGTIEDLLDYWRNMVKIYYDAGGGLIEVRVLAFSPEDAQKIAQAMLEKSQSMINDLSAIAREDAIRYSRQDLEEAVERLKAARQVVTQFRNRYQLVDPSIDLQSQAGLLGTLETQLAETLIELDLLRITTRDDDPRLSQLQRRVDVIRERIAAERQKLGIGRGLEDESVFATIVGEYERLAVDREFAEQSYTSALASYDSSLAEARRKSRYLAPYIRPTLAESSRYPQRGIQLGLMTLFLLLAWSTGVLVAYSIKDRR
ncbi:capsular polysaccharide transport system permease protein [Rhodovulum imhoffii]|uniref:Capsular polysaccharide transport system permease protein n=2 Tax=Rhodovulum imhoffii TaxID=365340 RepID=A0A2T5BPB8_9RHOB|nr:capsule biosynthesis protein [Rhodovulum imhoffii]PTN00872.1 capsular polysaccharide transport system permease protein [Rhodovulum imhoffii]